MKYALIQIEDKEYLYSFYEDKLAYFGLKEHGLKDLIKDFPTENFEEVRNLNSFFEKEVRDYFDGLLKTFKTPLYISGTAFQKSVYNLLKDIPYGKTSSYTELSEKLGDKKKVRALANAVGKNRHLILIPCHRVIAKDGTLGGFSGGLDLKIRLHEIEGIKVKNC